MSDPSSESPIQTPPEHSEPRKAWLVMCAHCGQGAEAPLPLDLDGLSYLLAQIGWFVSVLTPPAQGPEVPVVFGALCSTCAPTVFPAELLKAAEERRQEFLQASQVPR